MELTKEQIEFLDEVCGSRKNWTLNSKGEVDVDGDVCMNSVKLTEIPVKFGKVSSDFYCYSNQLTSLEFCPSEVCGNFWCSYNQLTSLEFCPSKVGGGFSCYNNQLTNYFKNIKEEDFPNWDKLYWENVLEEYPFLINIGKKYLDKSDLKGYLNKYPQTKLYLE